MTDKKNISCRLIILLNGVLQQSKFLSFDPKQYSTIKVMCEDYLPEKYKINTKYYTKYNVNFLQDEFTLDEDLDTLSIDGFTLKINYYSLAPVD